MSLEASPELRGAGGGVMHLQGASLHVGAPHVEWDPDVELVGHGLPFHQSELANVVAVVGRVHNVGKIMQTVGN